MPQDTARLIRATVEQYAAEPPPPAFANLKALSGGPGILRLRVGDWRVLFSKEGAAIAVIRIAPRGAAYR